MLGVIKKLLHIDDPRAPKTFPQWSDLPEDVQRIVISKLAPLELARAAAANRHLDALSRDSGQWADLLLGRGRQGPLPQHPRRAVGMLLQRHGMSKPVREEVRQLFLQGQPLDPHVLAHAEWWAYVYW